MSATPRSPIARPRIYSLAAACSACAWLGSEAPDSCRACHRSGAGTSFTAADGERGVQGRGAQCRADHCLRGPLSCHLAAPKPPGSRTASAHCKRGGGRHRRARPQGHPLLPSASRRGRWKRPCSC
jgi:hypothetical protein